MTFIPKERSSGDTCFEECSKPQRRQNPRGPSAAVSETHFHCYRRTIWQPQSLFKFEMCSYPPALFDSSLLPRQPNKPALADAIWATSKTNQTAGPTGNVHFVLDGGALLHRVPWRPGITYDAICSLYVQYIASRYGKATVVFDAYQNGPSTKDSTHQRRTGAYGPTVNFDGAMVAKLKKGTSFQIRKTSRSLSTYLGSSWNYLDVQLSMPKEMQIYWSSRPQYNLHDLSQPRFLVMIPACLSCFATTLSWMHMSCTSSLSPSRDQKLGRSGRKLSPHWVKMYARIFCLYTQFLDATRRLGSMELAKE